MDSVLVIGGCGALGHHIVNQLIDDKYSKKVTVFDTNIEHHRRDEVDYIRGSLTSSHEVNILIKKVKPRVTIHTASPNALTTSDPSIFDAVNVEGTRNLLAALQAMSTPTALVYTSSASVVHDNYTDLYNVTEELPLCLEPEQKQHYTHTKAIAEMLVLSANGKDNLATAAIRACSLFGEGDTTMTGPLIETAKVGKAKFQVGDGNNYFDFTYMGNTAYAHILASQALIREQDQKLDKVAAATKVNGEAFVITNDEPWPFWEMSRKMSTAAGFPVEKKDVWQIPVLIFWIMAVVQEFWTRLRSMGKRESVVNRKVVRFVTMTRTYDITKAKKRLGYRPKIGMQEAVERSARWYLANTAGSSKT